MLQRTSWLYLKLPILLILIFPSLCSSELPTLKHLIPITHDGLPSGVEGIDAIYVINLNRRTDRWAHITRLLDTYGLHAQRVSACDGEKLSESTIKELVGPYLDSCLLRRHPGAVGCLISHISVVYDASCRGFNCIWVLEDDVVIKEELIKINEHLFCLSSIDPEWDIFYTDPDFRKDETQTLFPLIPPPSHPDGEAVSTAARQKRKVRQAGNTLDRVYYRYGTHSMIISDRGIKKIVDYFLYSHLYTPIDIDIHVIPGIREYCPLNPIVTNGFGFSTDIRKRKKRS